MTHSFHYPFGALSLVLFLTVGTSSHANDIQITNVSLVDTDMGQGITHVAFDITWQNSWRGGGVSNWDAAWVFVKYRLANGVWQHAYVDNSGHTVPTGAQLELGLLLPGEAYNASTNPVIGVFLHRDADGNGTFNAPGARLRWDYGALGLVFNDLSAVQVFAIEMVYVNEEAFYLGSGGNETGSFTDGAWTAGNTIPYQVTSENTINIAQTPGSLWGTSSVGSNTIGPAGTLPAAFPKGYRGFYAMKYEITQQQYVDFLNTLSRTQQDARTQVNLALGVTSTSVPYVMTGFDFSIFRQSVRCDATFDANAPITFYCDENGNGIGGEISDGQWVAIHHINWADLAAYLDWSGLRPMTEPEFEKACRGPLTPVPNEYAWGNALLRSESPLYTFAGLGTASESIVSNYSTTAGNASYGLQDGPLRVGIFAANANNTGRMTAGASYYGIMELSGNLAELVVTVGKAEGRSFSGLHGDGLLNSSGDHDVQDWPTAQNANGIANRAGFWSIISLGFTTLQVSHRGSQFNVTFTRNEQTGGRGVRTAP